MYASSLTFPGGLFADFDDLQRQFDRLFGVRDGSIRAVGRGGFPAINVGSTADAVEIYAFVPGVDRNSLDVTVEKGVLSISGERKPDAQDASAKRNVYAQERASGSFRRVVSLPDDADAERVEADYRNGVLHVRVAKREASRPRRIEVSDAR